jgi:hypothetical protein
MGRIAVTPGSVAWQALQRIVEDPGAITCAELAVELAAELGEEPPALPAPAPASAEPASRWERLGLQPVFRSFDELAARREQRQAHEAAVADQRRRAQATMARLLSRLQAQGLIERRSPHITLAAAVADRARARGVAHAIAYARTAPPLFVDRPQPAAAWEGGDVTAEGEVYLLDDDADLEADDARLAEDADAEQEQEASDGAASPLLREGARSAAEGLRQELIEALLPGPLSRTELLGPAPSGARQRACAELGELGVISLPSHRRPTEAGRRLVLGHPW